MITDAWRLNEYFPGKPYGNRGISGQTTLQMLARVYPDVINLKPAAMVLLAGTNDIARATGPMTRRCQRLPFLKQQSGEEISTNFLTDYLQFRGTAEDRIDLASRLEMKAAAFISGVSAQTHTDH